MRTITAIGPVLLLAVCVTTVGADQIPPDLAAAALAHYPQWLRCYLARGDDFSAPSVPLSQDVQRGWLQARIETLSPGGQQVAVVVYKRSVKGDFPGLDRNDYLTVFVFDGTHWVLPPLAGQTEWVIDAHGTYWIDPSSNPDAPPPPKSVVFSDVDGDGVKEILLYGEIPGLYRKWQSIVVLAYRNGQLVPLTGLDLTMEPRLGKGPPECLAGEATFSPFGEFVSENGVGFIDMDGDGIPELLVYPKLGGDRPEGDPQHGRYYDVPRTGTRVYKLVNGVYTFQYETPVGTSGMPPIGAAMKPASVTVDELQGAASGSGGGKDDAVALYIMPPQGVTLDGVDWTSLRIGDFKIASTADRGVSPAPSPQASWVPFSFAGQPVLLEQLADKDAGQFQQNEKDPAVYIGMNGRLHMTTPFHEFRFSKKSLFAWAWPKWQAGAGDQQLKGCLPQGKHQRCFTPLHIPVKVNLTGNRGFAMGEAILWIETKEASAAPTPTH